MPIRFVTRAATAAGILAIGALAAQIEPRTLLLPLTATADVSEPVVDSLLGAGLLALASLRRPR